MCRLFNRLALIAATEQADLSAEKDATDVFRRASRPRLGRTIQELQHFCNTACESALKGSGSNSFHVEK